MARVLAGCVFASAALLRLGALPFAHIAHWGAGAYTAGPLGVGPYGKAELGFFYAPPLVPASFHALFLLFGAHDWLAIGTVALCGTLTVVVLYFAARSWFGSERALLAAAALASMQFHVLFSRQALTDVPYLLFFLLALWALSAALRTESWRMFALAGLAAGAAQWTKYHGFFVLIGSGAWILLARMRPPRRGLMIALAVFGVCALALALLVEQRIGLGALRANNVAWLAPLGAYVLPKTALFVARCLLAWVSWPVLALAALGFGRFFVRRSRFDLLVLAWAGLFLATLPFYANYPRLLLPLCVPLALAAAEGLLLIGTWFCSEGTLAKFGALALLALGAPASIRAARVCDDGYERAALFLRRADGDPRPDVLVLQHAVLFYLYGSAQPVLTYDEDGAFAALERGEFRSLAADLRLEHAPRFRAWIDAHQSELELVQTIPSPLLETALVNSAGFEGLRDLGDPELELERRLTLSTIRIWRRKL
jgi:hypothetical protein